MILQTQEVRNMTDKELDGDKMLIDGTAMVVGNAIFAMEKIPWSTYSRLGTDKQRFIDAHNCLLEAQKLFEEMLGGL
jgi:hypothetical protein